MCSECNTPDDHSQLLGAVPRYTAELGCRVVWTDSVPERGHRSKDTQARHVRVEHTPIIM